MELKETPEATERCLLKLKERLSVEVTPESDFDDNKEYINHVITKVMDLPCYITNYSFEGAIPDALEMFYTLFEGNSLNFITGSDKKAMIKSKPEHIKELEEAIGEDMLKLLCHMVTEDIDPKEAFELICDEYRFMLD